MIRRPPRSTLFPYTTLFRSPAADPSPVSPSDLAALVRELQALARTLRNLKAYVTLSDIRRAEEIDEDRKSTRLNSSHANISYAVFCLKKKKKIKLVYVHKKT